MNKTISNKINMIRKSFFFATNDYRRYQNSLSINGWLLAKPNIVILNDGTKVGRFLVYQIHKTRIESYPCQTFSKPLIEILEQATNVCLINCLGRIVYYSKYMIMQVEELQISHTFNDEPLDPPYVKKGEQ